VAPGVTENDAVVAPSHVPPFAQPIHRELVQ
jgi:hypothetical protein